MSAMVSVRIQHLTPLIYTNVVWWFPEPIPKCACGSLNTGMSRLIKALVSFHLVSCKWKPDFSEANVRLRQADWIDTREPMMITNTLDCSGGQPRLNPDWGHWASFPWRWLSIYILPSLLCIRASYTKCIVLLSFNSKKLWLFDIWTLASGVFGLVF